MRHRTFGSGETISTPAFSARRKSEAAESKGAAEPRDRASACAASACGDGAAALAAAGADSSAGARAPAVAGADCLFRLSIEDAAASRRD